MPRGRTPLPARYSRLSQSRGLSHATPMPRQQPRPSPRFRATPGIKSLNAETHGCGPVAKDEEIETGDPAPLRIALASTVAKTTRIRSIDSSASLLILFVVVAICHLLCLEHLGVPPEALSSLLSLMPWCLSSADSEGSKAGTMTRCTCEPTGECPGSHDLVLLGRLESRP